MQDVTEVQTKLPMEEGRCNVIHQNERWIHAYNTPAMHAKSFSFFYK
jgi:hypothetical protein